MQTELRFRFGGKPPNTPPSPGGLSHEVWCMYVDPCILYTAQRGVRAPVFLVVLLHLKPQGLGPLGKLLQY